MIGMVDSKKLSLADPEAQDPNEAAAELHTVPLWGVVHRWFTVNLTLLYFISIHIADRLGLRRILFLMLGKARSYRAVSMPIALRRAFEQLGPTYVKFGQLIASGEALFPESYSREFQKLLDRVPPFPSETVRAILEREFGGSLEEHLSTLVYEPLAAASIAQVHEATLHNGDEVVVKVQRPGIAARAAGDIAFMKTFARFAQRVSQVARGANLIGVIEDFELNLTAELDFRNEANHMIRFNEIMKQCGNTSSAAPIVHEALSSAHVLTMERFRGWSLGDTDAILGSPYDAEEKLLAGIRSWFQTLIVGGFFHGDVHAGNFMLLEDGRVGFLDFGIVGTFTNAEKENVLNYVLAFQSKDFDRLAKALIEMGTVDVEDLDEEQFMADLEVTLDPMFDPVEGFRMKELVPSLMRVSRAHRMRMPRELVLVSKQLVYLDRYSRALGGPQMNVLTDKRLQALIMQDMFAATFS